MKLASDNSIRIEHSVWSEKATSAKENIPIDWSGRVEDFPTWLLEGNLKKISHLVIGRGWKIFPLGCREGMWMSVMGEWMNGWNTCRIMISINFQVIMKNNKKKWRVDCYQNFKTWPFLLSFFFFSLSLFFWIKLSSLSFFILSFSLLKSHTHTHTHIHTHILICITQATPPPLASFLGCHLTFLVSGGLLLKYYLHGQAKIIACIWGVPNEECQGIKHFSVIAMH